MNGHQDTTNVDSTTKRRVLEALKGRGPSTLLELAGSLGTTGQAVRQHIKQLEAEGLVAAAIEAAGAKGGRPAQRFNLTRAGEHVFPKRYGDLATMLLDTVDQQLGPEAVRTVLAAAVEAKVAGWRPKLEGCRTLDEKLLALRSIYIDDDPWVEVVEREGRRVLIERNCPYLDVVQRRPALCSLTVHSLSRLLGCKVERIKRFQSGDGRCEFALLDEPVSPDAPLRLEGESANRTP